MNEVRYIGSQRYELVGTIPYRTRDGRETRLEQWATNCPQCDAFFIATRPLGSGRFELNRRCQKHKRPGQRVKL